MNYSFGTKNRDSAAGVTWVERDNTLLRNNVRNGKEKTEAIAYQQLWQEHIVACIKKAQFILYVAGRECGRLRENTKCVKTITIKFI